MFFAFAFALGLALGSFLNVCIYRIPRGMSIIYPPSHCPSCGYRLSPLDNIPVLSFLILRGKCRYCGAKISPRYPLVELLTGFLLLFLYAKTGLKMDFLFYLPLVACLVALSFIDIDTRRLPDSLTLPLTAIGLALSFLPGAISPPASVLGIISGLLTLYLVAILGKALFKKEALGGGDIKLMMAVGAFLGVGGVFFSLFSGSILGSIVGIGVMAKKKENIIPFGPFLSAGALLYLFAGKFTLSLLGF